MCTVTRILLCLQERHRALPDLWNLLAGDTPNYNFTKITAIKFSLNDGLIRFSGNILSNHARTCSTKNAQEFREWHEVGRIRHRVIRM
jgi:hypothetical protein